MSDLADLERRMADLERRLSNIVRVGQVVEADYAAGKVRVECDDFTTDWIPWKTRRAGGDVDWWAPEVGEQVEVISPSGLTEGAYADTALYSDRHPEPENSPDKHTVRYRNGDFITHDRSDGSLRIKLAGAVNVEAGGPAMVKTPSATVDAPETRFTGNATIDKMLTVKGGMAVSGGSGGATMQIDGDLNMKGKVSVEGDVSATGTIMDGGGNSNHHTH